MFDSGTAHYNLTEYKEALGDFKEAYRLTRDSTFLFNIAQCYRQLGDSAAAANFYRSYRREAPDTSNRTEVDRLIEEMDKAAAAQHGPPQETIKLEPARPPTSAQPTSSSTTSELRATSAQKPLTKKAWFWVVVAGSAVVVAGATVGIVLGLTPRAPRANLGQVNAN
ncbi:MAG: hypothetical protein NVS1B6_12000 [Steroidobacteraceae bacterium]